MIDYFPVDLVKTLDLPPNHHYLIGTCPHGILWYVFSLEIYFVLRKSSNLIRIGMSKLISRLQFLFSVSFGALTNGMTNHSKWRGLFPNIRSKVLTLSINMLFPIFRELILSWGLCDSSVDSINTLLSQPNDVTDVSNKDGFTSNAAIVMFGGAREAFLSAPNTYKVFLTARKGFVRLAIQNGAALVPAIAFGETNVYDTTQNENGSLVRKIQVTVSSQMKCFNK